MRMLQKRSLFSFLEGKFYNFFTLYYFFFNFFVLFLQKWLFSMRYIVFGLVLFSLCVDVFSQGIISTRVVTVRNTNAEDSVKAKKLAIRKAYIEVAKKLMQERGLSLNDVSQFSKNGIFDEEEVLKVFAGFIESFSISDEKISFDDYQANFNFKIYETRFNAWAFSVVKDMINTEEKKDIDSGNIYEKEDNFFIPKEQERGKDVVIVCSLNRSFEEWMYFYKEFVDKTLPEYNILSISKDLITIQVQNCDDDAMQKFVLQCEDAGMKATKTNPGEWVLEQKF